MIKQKETSFKGFSVEVRRNFDQQRSFKISQVMPQSHAHYEQYT
jgi:hypothetical protein